MILPVDTAVRWRRLELIAWAFVLALSFDKAPFGALAWFALVRPLWIISKLPAKVAFGSACLFSFFFNLFSIYWVAMVTPPGMVAAVTIVAFYYTAVLMMFWRLFQIRPIFGFVSIPFLWTGVEYFRTLSEFAFPWSDLGYTQSYFLYVIQIVSVLSVHGLSFLILVVNVLLWQLFRKELSPERRLTAMFVSLAIVAGLTAFGWIEMPRFPVSGTEKIALLQGSIPLEVKWRDNNQEHSYRLYDSLTQSVFTQKPSLYIWPETSAPSYLNHDPQGRSRIGGIANRSGSWHLVGSLAADVEPQKTRTYNACYQFDPRLNPQQVHRKVKLVPFSEHVPYQDHLPFLQKGFLEEYLTFLNFNGVQWWSNFYPGDSATIFQTDKFHYGVLICFETTFPEFVREMILGGADFVVGITNDTWFGRSRGIYQHARIFITRAVENRCWMARSANTGLTFVVDPYGRIRSDLELYEVGVLVDTVGLLDEYSIFTRVGDIIGIVSLLFTVSVLCILVTLWFVRKFIHL